MLHISTPSAPDLSIVVETVPSTCSATGAAECDLRETWIRLCCAGIAARDASISADDRLDLAVTLWDRPACQKACPRRAVDLLFSDQLACLN